MEFYNIHTHRVLTKAEDNPYHSSIVDINPCEFEEIIESESHHTFSCGIHPWYIGEIDSQMDSLREVVSHPKIVAIGETGMDRLNGPSLKTQIPLFEQHIELSESVKKPLIIHCVRAWEELIQIRRNAKPKQPWIIHGYRKKSELTERLVKEGFLFSVGERINIESLKLIPLDRLFCETDEAEIEIKEVYLQVSRALNIDAETLSDNIAANIKKVFPTVTPPKKYLFV